MFLKLSTHLKRTWYLPYIYLSKPVRYVYPKKSLVYVYLSR